MRTPKHGFVIILSLIIIGFHFSGTTLGKTVFGLVSELLDSCLKMKPFCCLAVVFMSFTPLTSMPRSYTDSTMIEPAGMSRRKSTTQNKQPSFAYLGGRPFV
jgi:hypothetical protein